MAKRRGAATSIERLVGELVENALEIVAMRQRQDKGSVVIRLELRNKGVASELIERFVDDYDSVWLELVREVWRKKFRSTLPVDSRERAKQMRFLQSRGFASRHIQSVFVSESSEEC